MVRIKDSKSDVTTVTEKGREKDRKSEFYNNRETELIRAIAAKNATNEEFNLLLYISEKYGLDPLLKEIWCIKRSPNEPALIMTSRDGYLKVAHKSGVFDGLQSGTLEGMDGNLTKAWCEVWRKDMTHSFKSEVRFSEYRQNSPVWQKYPSAMLIKVAEVFALKRAFSISGMVTQEEIDSGNNEYNAEEAFNARINHAEEDGVTSAQLERIAVLIEEKASNTEKTEFNLRKYYKVSSLTDLSKDQAEEIIERLEKSPAKKDGTQEDSDELTERHEDLFKSSNE